MSFNVYRHDVCDFKCMAYFLIVSKIDESSLIVLAIIVTLYQDCTAITVIYSSLLLYKFQRNNALWNNCRRKITLQWRHNGRYSVSNHQSSDCLLNRLFIYSGTDQRKHQSSASLAFVRGIHWKPVNSPHKWPATWKIFSFDDVIMKIQSLVIPHAYEIKNLYNIRIISALTSDNTNILLVCTVHVKMPIRE